jgi:predicted transcriptional regulator
VPHHHQQAPPPDGPAPRATSARTPADASESASSSKAPEGDTGRRRKPGELEARILSILAESGEPLTPGEVLDQLGPDSGLSYSAVVTTLTRLHAKEAVTRHRDGRAYRYHASADSSSLVAWRMSRLLNTQPDHGSVLARFVGSLDDEDEAILRDLLGPST